MEIILVTRENINDYTLHLMNMENLLEKEQISSYPEELKNFIHSFEGEEPDFVEKVCDTELIRWYVILVDETIVGYVVLNLNPEEGIIGIRALFILSEYRKKGYAKETIERLISDLKKDKQYQILSLKVFTKNKKAISLYEKLKFRPWSQEMVSKL